MISSQTALITLLICAVAHLMVAAVMGLFARYQVKYLAMAWIMAIFSAALFASACFTDVMVNEKPGMFHPLALMVVMSISFLQSIYPLSIPMPGFLQWGRMVRYALPAICLILFYAVAMLLGSKPVILHTPADLSRHLLTGDVLMRQAMMLVSFWYIINIFRLPNRLSHVSYPRYLVGYSMAVGLSVVFYLAVSINYEARLMLLYAVIFTLLNLYLFFRVLESMALELPRPVIAEVQEEPEEEEPRTDTDFNEMNLQRFRRTEFWMQHHVDQWTENTFNRDDLCRETGLNRHLLLQCLRSQGYNNVHDYINTYRINELKRRIQHGEALTLTDCLDAGFGTTKTARTCFLKQEGMSLDDYLHLHAPAQ